MGDKSKKTRLSFLLNDDEEDIVFPTRSLSFGVQRHAAGSQHSSRDRLGETGRVARKPDEMRASSMMAAYTSSSSRSRTDTASTRRRSSERSYMHRSPTSSELPTTGAEKRGVRKKRQRKFICDTCDFGFYTNSDLQKVTLSLRAIVSNCRDELGVY